MIFIKDAIYWFRHLGATCPDDDLEKIGPGRLECKKCGRKFFIFKTY